jgi:hypothetical protein
MRCEEPFNHSPDLAPSRGSPALARGSESACNAVSFGAGKNFPRMAVTKLVIATSRESHGYFWGGVGTDLSFLNCGWYERAEPKSNIEAED